MASINGVEIKNLKRFKDHEGLWIRQGTVYLNGEKLGFWSQDAWGGPDQFDFDTSLIEEACRDFKDGFDDDYKYKELRDDPEIFMNEVVRLKEFQSEVGRWLKGNFAVVYASNRKGYAYRVETDAADCALLTSPDIIDDLEDGIGEIDHKCVIRERDLNCVINKDNKASEFFYG